MRFELTTTSLATKSSTTELRPPGGEGGIRTLERLSPLPVFKTGAFNHSATSPLWTIIYLAQVEGIEPSASVLETDVLPLHHTHILVLTPGVEPGRHKRQILSLLCLPIPPCEQIGVPSRTRTRDLRLRRPLL